VSQRRCFRFAYLSHTVPQGSRTVPIPAPW